MPSSPKGPCSAGKTTSQPASSIDPANPYASPAEFAAGPKAAVAAGGFAPEDYGSLSHLGAGGWLISLLTTLPNLVGSWVQLIAPPVFL